jgi:hypothetical protein
MGGANTTLVTCPLLKGKTIAQLKKYIEKHERGTTEETKRSDACERIAIDVGGKLPSPQFELAMIARTGTKTQSPSLEYARYLLAAKVAAIGRATTEAAKEVARPLRAPPVKTEHPERKNELRAEGTHIYVLAGGVIVHRPDSERDAQSWQDKAWSLVLKMIRALIRSLNFLTSPKFMVVLLNIMALVALFSIIISVATQALAME